MTREIRTAPFVLAALLAAPASAQDPRAAASTQLPRGVTLLLETDIEEGLRYLADVQNQDGSWDAASRYGREMYQVAATGLAGLAFLAHGDTWTRGKYAEVVRKAGDYLISRITPIGLFASGDDWQDENPNKGRDERTMYGHAFATTFLAQVFGQEGDPARREKVRVVLRNAIKLTVRSQTDEGGWNYFPNHYFDEGTLTVTQLQALRSCRDAGLIVPKQTIDKGVSFIEASTDSSGWVRYRIGDRRIRPGVTCASVVALWNAGQYDTPLFNRIRDRVNASIRNDWNDDHHAEYVEYYLAQSKWIMGGRFWDEYYANISRFLHSEQHSDGHWEGNDADEYGSTFSTAIALIVLQLPYDRLPVYQR